MNEYPYCSDCHREAFCQYPCDSYGLEKKKPETLMSEVVKCKKEHLVDYLEIDVTDDLWLSVISGKESIEEVIDLDALLTYMEIENEKYCDDNYLCPTCRRELEKRNQVEEYWGSKMTIGSYLVCPKCG